MGIGVIFDGPQYGRVAPETTYARRGSLICERITDVAPGDAWICHTRCIAQWAPCYPKDSSGRAKMWVRE